MLLSGLIFFSFCTQIALSLGVWANLLLPVSPQYKLSPQALALVSIQQIFSWAPLIYLFIHSTMTQRCVPGRKLWTSQINPSSHRMYIHSRRPRSYFVFLLFLWMYKTCSFMSIAFYLLCTGWVYWKEGKLHFIGDNHLFLFLILSPVDWRVISCSLLFSPSCWSS